MRNANRPAELRTISEVPRSTTECMLPQYQSAELLAVATFGGTGLANISEVDVTCSSKFVSASPATVALHSTSTSTMTGMQAGTSTVAVEGWSSAPFQVQAFGNSVPVSLVRLLPVVWTGLSWTDSFTSVKADANTTKRAQFRPLHVLTAEGQTATVVVYAEFSDGSMQDVSEASEITVSVADNYKMFLSVSRESEGSAYILTVQPDAGTFNATHGIMASWFDRCSSPAQSLREDFGRVHVAMPRAISMTVTQTVSVIASTSDIISDSTIVGADAIPTSAYLFVVISFDDGTQRDVTSDDRTKYTAVGASNGLIVISPARHVTVQSGSTGAGVVTVEVSFTGFASHLSQNVTLTVMRYTSAAIELMPYPRFFGAVPTTTLRTIACTGGPFQRAEGTVRIHRSDGSSMVIYADQGMSISSSKVAFATVGAENVISGVSVGNTQISAEISGHPSVIPTPVALTVTNSPTFLKAFVIQDAATWSGTPHTFSAVVGSTQTLVIDFTFADGTKMIDGLRSAPFLRVSELLTFESSEPSSISVSVDGVATLLANNHNEVTIAAHAVPCQSVAPASTSTSLVFANLIPLARDGDIGNFYGSPMGPKNFRDVFTVSVVANAELSPVIVFELVIEPTLNIYAAWSCVAGATWVQTQKAGSATFACAMNEGGSGRVVAGGSAVSAPPSAASPRAELIVIGLRVTTEDAVLAHIGGTIFLRLVSDGDNPPTPSAALRAGDVDQSINGGIQIAPSSQNVVKRRQLIENILEGPDRGANRILGDADGDGQFRMDDVLFMQKYYLAAEDVAGANLTPYTELTTWQRRQMDPILNFLDDSRVIPSEDPCFKMGARLFSDPCPTPSNMQYLTAAFVGNYRLLYATNTSDIITGSPQVHDADADAKPLIIEAKVYDARSMQAAISPTTKVRFEVRLKCALNINGAWSDNLIQRTESGVGAGIVVDATDMGEGVFRASLDGPSSLNGFFGKETDVEVAVLVSTFDSLGGQLNERGQNYAWRGASIDGVFKIGAGFKAFTTFDLHGVGFCEGIPPVSLFKKTAQILIFHPLSRQTWHDYNLLLSSL